MTGRRRVTAIVCLTASLALAACSSRTDATTVPPTSSTASSPALSSSPAPAPSPALSPAAVRVLQLNLCNSGYAPCFSRRVIAQAASVIDDAQPDVVTVNEVCAADLPALQTALAAARPGGTVVARFRAAGDRRTGGPYRCLNEDEYGIGVLARLPVTNGGYATEGGLYAVQDPDDPEERAWVCLRAPGLFSVCTTHLANTVATVTLSQCEALLTAIVPATRARNPGPPVIVAGDLNVHSSRPPAAQSCLRPGYLAADDRGSQYVLTTTGATIGPPQVIDMNRATDHPGLLVTVTPG